MSCSNMNTKANFTQTIYFKGSETEYSAEIVAQDVTINCSPGDHRSGSSKVKLKNVVDYNWELKYYIGQLIACHVGGNVYAYTLKPKGKFAMIRVVNLETDQRILIKDFNGAIQDISFALTPQVILGCIDEEGNLFVHSVESNDDCMSCTLLLHVTHPKAEINCSNYRVIWCPYVPTFGENDDTMDDPAKLLVLLNGSKAEVWDVSIMNSKYGAGPLEPLDKYDGYVEIDGHSMDIIDASFSPDGTALATASLDGYVKFFQVYMIESEDPRCLHQWQPHDGKALSCLFFLDNVKSYAISDSKFWKFAITGANHNAELKVWSCESWTCLQTIRFEPSPQSMLSELFLKVSIDMSAEYLLMSDINNRILYILQIQKNEEDRLASISTISEFSLPSSVISFCIVNVTRTNLRCSLSTEDLYEENEDFEEEATLTAVAVKMIVLQPKSLQECIVTFKPEGSIASNLKSVYGNVIELGDSEENTLEEPELPKLNDLQSSVNLLIQQQQQNSQLTLMTPDDFNSPALTASPTSLRNSLEVTSPPTKKENPVIVDFQQPQKDNCASGGSSPSREVQEILSLNTAGYVATQAFFNKMENAANEGLQTNNFTTTSTEGGDTNNAWPNVVLAKVMGLGHHTKLPEEENVKNQDHKSALGLNKKHGEEDNHKIQDLNYRLITLESLVKEQNQMIKSLQQEIMSQNDKRANSDYDINHIFLKKLDIALNKHQTQSNKLLATFIEEQKRKEIEQTEKLVNSITMNINKRVDDSLKNIITTEIKVHILPPILGVFEKLQLQLDIQYSQKLNTIDQLLKSNINNLFNNKVVAESLGNSIINIIKPSLDDCYKEMIRTTLIPSWERVCHTMFQQIHNTFTQGTKEYTSSVENYMDRQRKVQDSGKDLINQMQTVSDMMQTNASKLASVISDDMHKQMNISFHSMQDKMVQMVTDVVKDQVRIGFRTHAAVLEDSVVNAVRSRAVTPSPLVIDTQVQISQLNNLISKGNIDLAFQQALSAAATLSDLSLVLFVCEKVKPQDVVVLQQHVLLSLIQQLGADLSHQTELKLRYLEEAILLLDVNNLMTREHVPSTLRELSKQLKIFISNNPGHNFLINMKMVLTILANMMNN